MKCMCNCHVIIVLTTYYGISSPLNPGISTLQLAQIIQEKNEDIASLKQDTVSLQSGWEDKVKDLKSEHTEELKHLHSQHHQKVCSVKL